MKREKVVVRRKNDASGQRLECVQIRQSAQKQRTATQTVWPAESDIWLSSREAPKFAKVEPSNAKYRVCINCSVRQFFFLSLSTLESPVILYLSEGTCRRSWRDRSSSKVMHVSTQGCHYHAFLDLGLF